MNTQKSHPLVLQYNKKEMDFQVGYLLSIRLFSIRVCAMDVM